MVEYPFPVSRIHHTLASQSSIRGRPPFGAYNTNIKCESKPRKYRHLTNCATHSISINVYNNEDNIMNICEHIEFIVLFNSNTVV